MKLFYALPAIAAIAMALHSCAEKDRVVEYPMVDFYTTETLDISRIELTDTATVLHFSAVYLPKFWIRLDKGTHIVADGKKLPCIGSDRLVLGEKFYIPESGRDTFSLTFPVVPDGVKSIDFSEERSGDAFRMFGIDLTGKKKPLPLNGMPKSVRMAPDRNMGLLEIPLKDGETAVNFHLYGYHAGIGKTIRLYVNNLEKDQEEYFVRIDTAAAYASSEFHLDGPAEMVMTYPIYTDFMAAPGETLDMYVDLTAHSYDVRRKHFPEAAAGYAPRPAVYFSGYYSALNYYLNNESCDELPFAPFLAGEGIDWRWTDDEYADNVIRRYREFADSLAKVPAAASVKEFYAGGLKNSTLNAFCNSVYMRRSNFCDENGWGVQVPDFKPLSPSALSRITEIVDVNDSSLMQCMDALSYMRARSSLKVSDPLE